MLLTKGLFACLIECTKMSFRHYYIKISGSAHAKEGKHYAQSWVAGTAADGQSVQMDYLDYDSNKHNVNGNVVFDKHLRAVPYASYVARGAVNVDRDMDPSHAVLVLDLPLRILMSILRIFTIAWICP